MLNFLLYRSISCKKILSEFRGKIKQELKSSGPKTRFPEAGYPADTRRISGGYPAEIRRISALRRSPPDGFSVTSRAHLSPHWLEQGGEWRRAGAGTTRPAVATLLPVPTNGERDAPALIRDVTENPSGGLLRSPDIRRVSAGYPPGIRRISAGYPPSGNRVLGAFLEALKFQT